ncbi:MAG: immunity 53 family protein [Cellvibrio sp.]
MLILKNDLNLLTRLQQWYLSMCNGDWEHTYGVSITNIDNPGWALTVELADTYLYGVEFQTVEIQREEDDDWVFCRVKDGEFDACGGPQNLNEMLAIFLNWAESNRHLESDG